MFCFASNRIGGIVVVTTFNLTVSLVSIGEKRMSVMSTHPVTN